MDADKHAKLRFCFVSAFYKRLHSIQSPPEFIIIMLSRMFLFGHGCKTPYLNRRGTVHTTTHLRVEK